MYDGENFIRLSCKSSNSPEFEGIKNPAGLNKSVWMGGWGRCFVCLLEVDNLKESVRVKF